MSKSKSSMPGPGTYHIPSWNDGEGVSILERHPTQATMSTPGPGMYDISLKSDKGVAYSFSGTDTIDPELKERMNTPGVNQYTPKHTQTKQRIKGGVIGSRYKDKENEETNMGPGYYTVYDVNGDKVGITMGEKHPMTSKLPLHG